MDGKQLKNSILQWAIQGKLVSQNPKDEPAQKLLEKIALSRHSERSEESSKRTKKASTSLRGAKATKQSKNSSSHIYRENGVWYEQVGTATPRIFQMKYPLKSLRIGCGQDGANCQIPFNMGITLQHYNLGE